MTPRARIERAFEASAFPKDEMNRFYHASALVREIESAERAAREEEAEEISGQIKQAILSGSYNSTIEAVLQSWLVWIRARHAKKQGVDTRKFTVGDGTYTKSTPIEDLPRRVVAYGSGGGGAGSGCSVSSVSGNTFLGPDEARVRELVREGIEADHVLHDLGRDVRVRKMVGEELKTKIREWIKTERIT